MYYRRKPTINERETIMIRNDRQAHQAIVAHVIKGKTDKQLARELATAELILRDAGEFALVDAIRRERAVRFA